MRGDVDITCVRCVRCVGHSLGHTETCVRSQALKGPERDTRRVRGERVRCVAVGEPDAHPSPARVAELEGAHDMEGS